MFYDFIYLSIFYTQHSCALLKSKFFLPWERNNWGAWQT